MPTLPARSDAETHAPDFGGLPVRRPRRGAALWRGVLVAFTQFVFIAAGVFLGMRADEWRQTVEHRRAARATLRNFREEIARNRAAVARNVDYHQAMMSSLDSVRRVPARSLEELVTRIRFQGARSVAFAHTAYDLALATQSFAYLPPDVAFAIADVYLQQEAFQKIQDSYLGAIYATNSFSDANVRSLSISLAIYMGDVTYQEPALVALYDKLLPRIDATMRRLPP